MLLVSLVVLVALVTVMSGIGVGEHCGYGGGGIYSMISTVLGARVGGTMGLLYVFGQVSTVYVKVVICIQFGCNICSNMLCCDSASTVCGWSDVHHRFL